MIWIKNSNEKKNNFHCSLEHTVIQLINIGVGLNGARLSVGNNVDEGAKK